MMIIIIIRNNCKNCPFKIERDFSKISQSKLKKNKKKEIKREQKFQLMILCLY